MLDLTSVRQIAGSLRVCATPGGDCGGCYLEHSAGLCSNRLKKDAANTMEALALENARLREEKRWIPTAERLPDLEDGSVLTIGELTAVEVLVMIQGAEKPTCLYFDDEDFFDIQGGELIPYRVTHWRPMPRGPEAAQ